MSKEDKLVILYVYLALVMVYLSFKKGIVESTHTIKKEMHTLIAQKMKYE